MNSPAEAIKRARAELLRRSQVTGPYALQPANESVHKLKSPTVASSRMNHRTCYTDLKIIGADATVAARGRAFSMTRNSEDITGLLHDASNGDAGAGESLYQCIYDELVIIGRAQRRRWSGTDTLSTTAIVH